MFRIPSPMPAAAFKTYQILAPAATHHRPATCAEVECGPYLHGWETVIDEATELGQRQAHHVRKGSGREYFEMRDAAGLTTFTFPPGQRCFGAQHTVPLGRPEIFRVRGGDWRGNPRGDVRTHTRSDDWVDDFATHQQHLADRLQQG